MNMAKRLEALEAALAKQSGDTDCRLVVRADGETDEQARERAGLAAWPGPVLFLSESDARL